MRTLLCKFQKKTFIVLFICVLAIYRVFLHNPRSCITLCPYQSILTHDRLTFDESHFVQHFSEFICPRNFRNLADWIYDWPDDMFNEHLDITTDNGHYISPCLVPGSIIFVKADHLGIFFKSVYPSLKHTFVLITGQSDKSSPGSYLSYLEDIDSKIIHWFGQNADIYSSISGKFTAIPIGINCYEMAEGIRSVYRPNPNDTVPSVYGGNDEPLNYIHPLDLTRKLLSKKFDSQLLLLNFQRKTDPTGFRSRIWESLCTSNTTSQFVICIDKPEGVNITGLSTIYTRNRQYPFWLSPRGNGLDCHRTWEALYLDAIPVVWNSTLNSLYIDLPVIVLDQSDTITEQLLRTKLQDIIKNKVSNPPTYRIDKLRFSYWRRLILSKSRYPITVTKRENQCWRAKTTI